MHARALLLLHIAMKAANEPPAIPRAQQHPGKDVERRDETLQHEDQNSPTLYKEDTRPCPRRAMGPHTRRERDACTAATPDIAQH